MSTDYDRGSAASGPSARDLRLGRDLALHARLDAIEAKVDRLMARLGPEPPEPETVPKPAPTTGHARRRRYDMLRPISAHLIDRGWDRL